MLRWLVDVKVDLLLVVNLDISNLKNGRGVVNGMKTRRDEGGCKADIYTSFIGDVEFSSDWISRFSPSICPYCRPRSRISEA